MAEIATRDAAEWPRLGAVNHAWSFVENAMNLIAAAAIFFLMFIGVVQIVGRTVFGVAIYGYIDYMEQSSALFAFLGIAYAQRAGAHIRMDLLLRGVSLRFLWVMELFAVLVAFAIVTLLIFSTYENFQRAYQLGDSTMDIKLPTWPSKLLVPVALGTLWIRIAIQSVDYCRLIRYPDAAPIAVPKIETAEAQAKSEIEEALGREAATLRDSDAGRRTR